MSKSAAKVSQNSGQQATPLLDKLQSLSDKIIRLANNTEQKKGNLPEFFVFILWSVIFFVTSALHERWFDEAVSWQIAKNATIREILTTIPPLEGHPPFWHLLLAVFAKLGMPYHLSMTIISYAFMGLFVFLLLKKNPLPRIVRLTLPFSFFLIYQYAVITRPYCVMALALLLLGLNHNERNQKPLRYVLCLLLLCMTSAYGIIVAGGICIVWSIEILREKITAKNLMSILKDKRFYLLAVLLVAVLLMIWEFLPTEKTFAMVSEGDTNSFLFRIVYCIFIMPIDGVLTNIFSFDCILKYVYANAASMIPCVLVGTMVLFFISYYGCKKNTLLYYWIPTLLFAGFSSVVYFSQHHIGIPFLYMIFWLMITFSSKEDRPCKYSNHSIIRSGTVIFTTVCLVMSTLYGFVACLHDCQWNYSFGKREADFIKKYQLEQYKIMSSWATIDKYDEQAPDRNSASYFFYFPEVEYHMPGITHYSEPVNAYMGHNIIDYTLNPDPSRAYTEHRILSDEEYQEFVERCKQIGQPDVLIGSALFENFEHYYLTPIWGEEAVKEADYKRVYLDTYAMSWKLGKTRTGYSAIFVREEIADKLNLTVIPDTDIPILN
ncbi:MAG: hypothetical protein IJM46_03025 [Oscillospiraceae bacterium]|nr:hypothetical protein [Oscillospiraceae bacterium]